MKLVRTGAALSADDLTRFRFEAESAAGLDHPHVVRVFAFGEADGVPYLVMPLMGGGSLAQWLKELGPDRRLPPKVAAGLVRDVALGVHHAHLRGLIHRDLKPGNVLRDAAGQLYVADFGLARSLDASASASGGVAGTAAYMAPEQARGEKGLTVAADVHALGAILFELLTGQPPFGGGGDWFATLKRVQEEPAPSARGLRPDVPDDLDVICRTCLAKEPADRYPSAQALADDLARFLGDEPPISHSRRGVIRSVVRAIDRRRETLEMTTWAAPFWGAASTLLALAVLQAAVLLGAPGWVPAAALAYYLVAWFGIVWGFLVACREVMNPVETGSMAVQLGMLSAAAAATVPYWLHGGSAAAVFQPVAAVVGLGVYVHGILYWGRLYLAGLLILATAAVMPLIPVAFWPGVYGVAMGAFQVWVGFHLARVHRQARADAARWPADAGRATP
jgi:serine/threonine-protein kinase